MSDLIRWILGNFWHFVGAFLLLDLTFVGIANIILAAVNRSQPTVPYLAKRVVTHLRPAPPTTEPR